MHRVVEQAHYPAGSHLAQIHLRTVRVSRLHASILYPFWVCNLLKDEFAILRRCLDLNSTEGEQGFEEASRMDGDILDTIEGEFRNFAVKKS